MKNFKKDKQNHRINQNKIVIFTICGIVTLAALSFFAYKMLVKPNTNQISNPGTDTSVNDINMEPATEEEKQQAEDHKDDLVKQQETEANPKPAGQKKQVSPSISSADQTMISVFVSGVFEDGGTCTATITGPGNTIKKTSVGFANASYTSCEPIFLSRSDFSKSGTWSVSVAYSSSTADGTSANREFNVQ